MNEIIKIFVERLKNNFEENNKELKNEKPIEYEEKLEKYIFRMYMFVCVVIMFFGVFVTFFVTEILL